MKYRICDLKEFETNVFGADCFLKNFPEITTTGVELKKFGSDHYIVKENGLIEDITTFFTEKEMVYLEPVLNIVIEKGFKTPHSFERTELRTIYFQVEEDLETFTNIAAHIIAEKQNEIDFLKEELEFLKSRK